MECVRTELWWVLRDDLSFKVVSSLLRGLFDARYVNLLLFCSPEGLREVFLTGGLPPLINGPDPIYEKTYRE